MLDEQDTGETPLVELSGSNSDKRSVSEDRMEEGEVLDGQSQPSYLVEKFVFVMATIGVIGLSHATVWLQWVLPAVFVFLTPFLIAIRVIAYWRNKWQFFLIDFCYLANSLTFVYLWLPYWGQLFQVVFAFGNGPLLAATALYGNAVVFHRYDKMTSVYIHMVPGLLTFSMRWFPGSTSWLIHQLRFSEVLSEAPPFDAFWLYVVPVLIYLGHTVCYCLLINVIVCPKDPYWSSYSFLRDKYKKISCLSGPMGQGVMYYGLNTVFCLTTLLVALLCYSFFYFHCAFIALVFLVALWNGACYYVDVFSIKGFHDENDTG